MRQGTHSATSLLPLTYGEAPANASAFLPFKLSPRVLAIGGKFQSIDFAPLLGTNRRFAVPQPSPRNPKSPYPMEKQREIYEAAELKRAARAAKRIGIDPSSTDF